MKFSKEEIDVLLRALELFDKNTKRNLKRARTEEARVWNRTKLLQRHTLVIRLENYALHKLYSDKVKEIEETPQETAQILMFPTEDSRLPYEPPAVIASTSLDEARSAFCELLIRKAERDA